jgi:hypothetical protein
MDQGLKIELVPEDDHVLELLFQETLVRLAHLRCSEPSLSSSRPQPLERRV